MALAACLVISVGPHVANNVKVLSDFPLWTSLCWVFKHFQLCQPKILPCKFPPGIYFLKCQKWSTTQFSIFPSEVQETTKKYKTEQLSYVCLIRQDVQTHACMATQIHAFQLNPREKKVSFFLIKRKTLLKYFRELSLLSDHYCLVTIMFLLRMQVVKKTNEVYCYKYLLMICFLI